MINKVTIYWLLIIQIGLAMSLTKSVVFGFIIGTMFTFIIVLIDLIKEAWGE